MSEREQVNVEALRAILAAGDASQIKAGLAQAIKWLEREVAALRIERDNLDGAREWAVTRLYPYVLAKAGPLPVPLERIAELAAQRIDELARQQSSDDNCGNAFHRSGTKSREDYAERMAMVIEWIEGVDPAVVSRARERVSAALAKNPNPAGLSTEASGSSRSPEASGAGGAGTPEQTSQFPSEPCPRCGKSIGCGAICVSFAISQRDWPELAEAFARQLIAASVASGSADPETNAPAYRECMECGAAGDHPACTLVHEPDCTTGKAEAFLGERLRAKLPALLNPQSTNTGPETPACPRCGQRVGCGAVCIAIGSIPLNTNITSEPQSAGPFTREEELAMKDVPANVSGSLLREAATPPRDPTKPLTVNKPRADRDHPEDGDG